MLSTLNEFVEQKLYLCNTRLIIFHLMKVTRHTIFLLILYTIITKLEMEIKCVIILFIWCGILQVKSSIQRYNRQIFLFSYRNISKFCSST
ncbi:hypothetical protein GLOIN_2v32649 [Rhizophagus irregularis DAOM 181602=DAOM 197198]|uniref:Uncharacterized protein n=1 Tax=Rhizophagus irregularis (strain DAOM 181602 / DAOM 197198 / MUCL 43194) TaxID=747089 RepID=A0A2P4NK13_RHIID|nr:hypothetical protein GLOIN_2v32649 [Rhizophagus irregularis DAOM 181602=DAOM 197198]POG53475.1 hypothetical protein GLOIN_2v32649 [Rhizophagus irregularis DAOM 181602=DAOM 197198]|eukprot:XP_025164082.1 hypothetical protein GLOIN_2v32649 [Rhizophagus irregularis DAOM 181602=DAOM 197198]